MICLPKSTDVRSCKSVCSALLPPYRLSRSHRINNRRTGTETHNAGSRVHGCAALHRVFASRHTRSRCCGHSVYSRIIRSCSRRNASASGMSCSSLMSWSPFPHRCFTAFFRRAIWKLGPPAVLIFLKLLQTFLPRLFCAFCISSAILGKAFHQNGDLLGLFAPKRL